MKKNFALRALALAVSGTLGLGFLAGCSDIPVKKDALVIMTEDLNELYNPFYSTAGTDMDVVGQTQISMLSTDENGSLAYGNDEPTLVLDYKEEYKPGSGASDKGTTEYTFVLKNGLKFSDGVPVTMNDVMFNLYVYLDPAYTGSSTMYSTDIVGLANYRAQKYLSGSTGTEDDDNIKANTLARNRANELSDLFNEVAGIEGSHITGTGTATKEQMYAAIATHTFADSDISYKAAIGVLNEENSDELAREQLKKDYDELLEKFQEELKNDYKSARNSYSVEPYTTAPIYVNGTQAGTGFDEVISFMYAEGFVSLDYPRNEDGVKDKSRIEKATLDYNVEVVTDEASAISYVYNSKVDSAIPEIIDAWATGTQLRTEFAAKAKDVLLHGRLDGDQLNVPCITGIVSLGHNTQETQVTIGDRPYPVARTHNDDGTPMDPSTYDVLRITINGQDPKAKWNFGFTVAPYHYYSDPSDPELEIDIEHDKFGVKWTSFDFHQDVLQGSYTYPGTNVTVSKNKVPLGAGPYVATNEKNEDNPTADGFFRDDVVYYKANKYFSLDGKTSATPKIEKMRYQVVPTANAIASLESGSVHFISPQFTRENSDRLEELKSKGVGSVDSWQLGYGYIGINAAEVKQLPLRKAIMQAMDTSLALDYYSAGTAVNIRWPMSAVSWAYPRLAGTTYDGSNPTSNMETNNDHPYAMWDGGKNDKKNTAVKQKIEGYMNDAHVTKGSPELTIEFTIAGANMYDHPAYAVFKRAMDILNDCGWDVTLKPDANALTKLATGSLAVWAAAWGSTIDPDMYQVYHKNSTATSVLAWGYPSILNTADAEYEDERTTLNELSDLIDRARETTDESVRAPLYRQAMGKVLDLAVELPLYQRETLYAYNLNVIKESSFPHDENGKLTINPYTSPLSRIWEIEFTD